MTGVVLILERYGGPYGMVLVAVPFPTMTEARDWEEAHAGELQETVRGVAQLVTRGELTGDAPDR